MQLKRFNRKLAKTSIIFITILCFMFFLFSSKTSAAGRALTQEEKQSLVENELKDCPEQIKSQLLNNDGGEVSVEGTYVLSYDADGNPQTYTGCSSIHDIEKLVLKVFTILNMIIGLVLTFAMARGGIMMMAANADPEKFETAVSSLKTSIGATVGTFFAYLLIIFILTGVLGIGTNDDKPEYNIICQQRLVFSLTFNTDPCAAEQ